MKKQISMVEGNITPNLISFTVPIILSALLQFLYNMADTVVVGKFAGKECLAAVGSTGSITGFVVNFFTGISVGACIVIAKNIGAENRRGTYVSVHTVPSIAIIIGFVLGALGFIFSKKILIVMNAPEDVIDLADLYLKIYFIGVPANSIYNFGASILRASGDTKRPLYFLTVSGIINVILNLILVIRFHMDVAGVAIATVVSQVISAILVTVSLIKNDDQRIRLFINKIRINKDSVKAILYNGLPSALQSCTFSVSNMLIQSQVNIFGSSAMAGNAASNSLENIPYIIGHSIYESSMTFTSQNLGAKKIDRIKKICISSTLLNFIFTLIVSVVCVLFSGQLMKLFSDNPEVIKFGIMRFEEMAIFYIFCGFMDVGSGMLKGVGYSIVPFINTIVATCGFRILWVFTYFNAHPTLKVLWASWPISWVIGTVANYTMFIIVIKKISKKYSDL